MIFFLVNLSHKMRKKEERFGVGIEYFFGRVGRERNVRDELEWRTRSTGSGDRWKNKR